MALTVSSSLCFLSDVMRKKGYTLTEVVVVVMVLGVMAAVAIPRLPFAAVHQSEARGEARRLVAELRRVRSMALRDAATNSKGFEMVMDSTGVCTGYDIDDLDSHDTLDTYVFDDDVTVTAGTNKYDFGPLGNLIKGEGTEITVAFDTVSLTISFVATTGAVILTEN
jgi:prepilin-type N-terminal cleavage/methylation domain-containing protein